MKQQTLHVTEKISERMRSRELHEARISGNAAPEMDVHTGAMINPHNPEFLTKRPWYLGGDEGQGPSLSHQIVQGKDLERSELSIGRADMLIHHHRNIIKRAKKENRFNVGMWAESLRYNKKPYLICQIIKMNKNGTIFDLKYDDGVIERNVTMNTEQRGTSNAKIRLTGTGARTAPINQKIHGKETYDTKRDTYLGYQMNVRSLEEKFSKREAMRRKTRIDESHSDQNNNKIKNISKKEKNENFDSNNETNSDSDSDYNDSMDDSEDEFVQRDEDARVHVSRTARQGGVGGQQLKITARNLRIREDTAKYLWNLDINSAYYDPKSRSMRDNPHINYNKNTKNDLEPSDVPFAGDNFTRISGDVVNFSKTQVFAWDIANNSQMEFGGENMSTTEIYSNNDINRINEKNQNHSGIVGVHLQSNPSQSELLQRKFNEQKTRNEDKKRKAVLEKYGGEEYLDSKKSVDNGVIDKSYNIKIKYDDKPQWQYDMENERRTRFGMSIKEERYMRDGRIVVTNCFKKFSNLTSKYEEDKYRNGHVVIWGSFFHTGTFQWGYADDHSLLKNSYGTGVKGRIVNDEINLKRYGSSHTCI